MKKIFPIIFLFLILSNSPSFSADKIIIYKNELDNVLNNLAQKLENIEAENSTIVSKNIQLRILIDELEGEINTIKLARSPEIPSSAVVAFDLKNGCPDGWSNYLPAKDRFVLGQGTHNVGKVAGEKEIILTSDQLPGHSHEIKKHNHSISYTPDATGVFTASGILGLSGEISSRKSDMKTGGDPLKVEDKKKSVEKIDLMPPYVVLRYCIKTSREQFRNEQFRKLN